MSVSTHVLDITLGAPAAGIGISLAQWSGSAWMTLCEAQTDQDGRVASLLTDKALQAADVTPCILRLRFETAAYFATRGQPGLYPYVEIIFNYVHADDRRYHLPLLLTANGYTTYRGS